MASILSNVANLNIRELTDASPELARRVQAQGFLDLEDSDTLAQVVQTQLALYLDLTVRIDPQKLIPRISSRLAYVTWLNSVFPFTGCTGLDIGTGPYSIYALIACKLWNTTFIATDIDAVSVKRAFKVVEENTLPITVELVHPGHMIPTTDEVDFVVCNPPFYNSSIELHPNKEFMCLGGELEFAEQLLQSSLTKSRLKWCSIMFGFKSNFREFVTKLRSIGLNYACHRILFGRTTRWIVAWSHTSYWPCTNDVCIKNFDLNPRKAYFETQMDNFVIPEHTYMEGDALKCKGITWSRHYRRTGHIKGSETDIKLCYENNVLKLLLLKGDYNVFESLTTWFQSQGQK